MSFGTPGFEGISLSKKDLPSSKQVTTAVKKLVFAHKASAGELTINLQTLNTPTEMSANGFLNASPAEIAAARLLFNKKNIVIRSSRGITLEQFVHFKVSSSSVISFIGDFASSGGALADEIFVGEISNAQPFSSLITDARMFKDVIVVPVGTTTVNIGRIFKVNENPATQVGDVLFFRNGTALMLRNVGNATAAPAADGNYQEIDSGNGYGTVIELNNAPVGDDDFIVAVFGLQFGSGDIEIFGSIEQLAGAALAMAADLAIVTGNPITNYISGNPSQVERRTFGDLVLSIDTIVDELNLRKDMPAILRDEKANGTDGGTFTSGSDQTRVLNTLIDPYAFVTSLIANQFVLPAGTYCIRAEAPAYQVGSHRLILRNITDATTIIRGGNAYSAVSDDAVHTAHLSGVFTLTAPKTLELQHRSNNTKATNGFGVANSFTETEVYSTVEIRKIR